MSGETGRAPEEVRLWGDVPVPFNDDGEAVCECGDFIYRITPTDRIESIFLSDQGVVFETEDYDDVPGAETYECNGCRRRYEPPEQITRPATDGPQ